MRPLRCLVHLLILGPALVAAPAASLPRSAPEAQGVSSAALLDFLDTAEARIDALHSVMLVRHGKVVVEGWWAPYAAEEPHQMFSLSKSFTSTAVGLALNDGKLALEDPVLKFFPDAAPGTPSANLRAMRIRDLLTMSTGHHAEDIQGFSFVSAEDPVKKFLSLPVTHKPGTLFIYSTPATFMLSAIVQKVTGQSVLEYLRPRLFAPLGIADPTWEATRQGVSIGGTGLSLRTEDIAKFGQLYLQKGKWGEQQLVPASWVATATSRWMSNGSNPASDWDQGYGFQFWRCRYGVIRGDGAHGQFCVIFPEHDAVLAITAGTRDLQGVLNVVWEKLLPALGAKPLSPDGAAVAKLQARVGALALKQPKAIASTPALARTVADRRYVFPRNPLAIEAVSLAPSADDPAAVELAVTLDGANERVVLKPGEWIKGEMRTGPFAGAVAVSGAWTGEDTFSVELVRYRTPFTISFRLTFAGDELRLVVRQNVGPAPLSLVGKRE